MAILTFGQIGKRLGLDTWKVQKAHDRGHFKARRAGRLRVITEDELPAVTEALRKAGYLPHEQAANAQ